MNLCYGFTNVLALSASAGNLTPANVKEMSDGDRCSSTEKRKTTDLVILKPWMLAGHSKKDIYKLYRMDRYIPAR